MPTRSPSGCGLLVERLGRTGLLSAEPRTVFRRAECERLVGLRRLTEPLLLRSQSRARPSRDRRRRGGAA